MRKYALLFVTVAVLILANAATAHPLGNFSINDYSRIEVEKSQIKLRGVLDLAEIPTFQESAAIDTNGDKTVSAEELNVYVEKITPEYISNLNLTVNNQPLTIRAVDKNATLPVGSAGLPTMRIEWNFVADLPQLLEINALHFENKNNAGRIGWNEIAVNRTSGINIYDSTAFGNSITDELKTYPEDMLTAPLTERIADFSFTSNQIPPGAKPLQNRDGRQTAPVQTDRFAELINVKEITLPIILFGLVLAFGFGAMHAMSPGHGKAVVGAYLVGSRGTIKHAVFLGLTVTITHTLGVFALGLTTLFASKYILPESLFPVLSFVSGLILLVMGLSLFRNRLMTALGRKDKNHDHDHANGDHENLNDDFVHTHGGSTHSHLPPQKVTWRSLLALGISGGLLPCPSALVLMLSAIASDRVGYGLLLTTFFSVGLATTLTSIGLIFLYAGKVFGNSSLGSHRIFKALPVFSAFVIACIGAVICYTSLQ